MDTLDKTLRRVLGRSRFGLYALGEDGSRPVLVVASSDWPPSDSDPLPALEEPGLWTDLTAGRMRRFAELPRRGPRWPLTRELALLPVGNGRTWRGALVLHARARAAVWSLPEEDWAMLAATLDLHLRVEEQGRALAAIRGFQEVLLANLPLGVLSIDPMGRVTYLSPVAEKVLGYQRPEAEGSDCLRIFRPAGVEENPLLLGLRGKASRVELFIADREGMEKPVWVQMNRVPSGRNGADDGLLVLIRDTSEERAFEEDQRRRERLASIGELSAGVAHEIRNPLTGIGNCAQVLRDRIPAEDPRQRFVQIILDETARLNRIVESLLSFARPGRPQLKESVIVDVVARVVELEKERMARDGIASEIKVRGRIPAVFIDPEQITQVLLNVIRNAEEALPSGGRLSVECSVIRRRPHIRRGTGQRRTDRIRYDRQAPLKRYVQLRIVDTGRGIAKDAMQRIFDPFFTTRPRGTGLGLSISQSIIKEHGGLITVHSIENKGTTVTIDLPVERREGERRRHPG